MSIPPVQISCEQKAPKVKQTRLISVADLANTKAFEKLIDIFGPIGLVGRRDDNPGSYIRHIRYLIDQRTTDPQSSVPEVD